MSIYRGSSRKQEFTRNELVIVIAIIAILVQPYLKTPNVLAINRLGYTDRSDHLVSPASQSNILISLDITSKML